MSVNPGFGGQTFIPRSESKVAERARAARPARQHAAPIEIDGGIDADNAARVVAAGARILVAGIGDLRHAAIPSGRRAS